MGTRGAGSRRGGGAEGVTSTACIRESVFSLTHGRLILRFPAVLTAEDVEDIHDFLEIFQRGITRASNRIVEVEGAEGVTRHAHQVSFRGPQK